MNNPPSPVIVSLIKTVSGHLVEVVPWPLEMTSLRFPDTDGCLCFVASSCSGVVYFAYSMVDFGVVVLRGVVEIVPFGLHWHWMDTFEG